MRRRPMLFAPDIPIRDLNPTPQSACLPMASPNILTVDDDPQVLAAIARDLRRQYGKDYRIIVQQHRGQILVESEPGKTRFRVQLPRS